MSEYTIQHHSQLEQSDIDKARRDHGLPDSVTDAEIAAHETLRLIHHTFSGVPDGANVFDVTDPAGVRHRVDLGANETTQAVVDQDDQPTRGEVAAVLDKLTEEDVDVLYRDLRTSALLAANQVTDDSGLASIRATLDDYATNSWF